MSSASSSALLQRLARNLAAARDRVDAACHRVDRKPHDVRIVAVTKYESVATLTALAALGHQDFGENRPQQLVERSAAPCEPEFPESTGSRGPSLAGLRWHLIGQLQRNKVRSVLPYTALIHSVDSLKLLERIGQIAGELQRVPELLLQVNVSGEASKSGFSPDELRRDWEKVTRIEQVQVRGLMTMAPESADEVVVRDTFRGLRLLRDQLRRSDLPLDELSMGMSQDFEMAVEEGATMVRLGSVLFEGCDPASIVDKEAIKEEDS